MDSTCRTQSSLPYSLQFSDTNRPQQRYHHHEKNSFLFCVAPLLILSTACSLGCVVACKEGSVPLIVTSIGLSAATVVVVGVLVSIIAISVLNNFCFYFTKEIVKSIL